MPAFVDGHGWAFAGKVDEPSAAPLGFEQAACTGPRATDRLLSLYGCVGQTREWRPQGNEAGRLNGAGKRRRIPCGFSVSIPTLSSLRARPKRT